MCSIVLPNFFACKYFDFSKIMKRVQRQANLDFFINKKLKDDIGKVALQRGPLMYCAEWPDNNGSVSTIVLPAMATFTTKYEPALLNGVVILKSEINKVEVADNKVSTSKQAFAAIPYYAWANRGKGEMMLWFPEQVKSVDIISQ